MYRRSQFFVIVGNHNSFYLSTVHLFLQVTLIFNCFFFQWRILNIIFFNICFFQHNSDTIFTFFNVRFSGCKVFFLKFRPASLFICLGIFLFFLKYFVQIIKIYRSIKDEHLLCTTHTLLSCFFFYNNIIFILT